MSIGRVYGNSRLVIAIALLAAFGAGGALMRSGAIGQEAKKEVNPQALRHAQELSEAFSDAAEIAMPCVVTIHSRTKTHPVSRKSGGNRGESPFGRSENPFKGTPFEDMFNGRNLEEMVPQTPRREGMGSGVIIDRKGIVLTNNHVVEGADEVTVRLADGREFKGEDIKTDVHTDLAVVHIKGAGTLPAVALGDSDKMRIGDWVIAIGNPFGFEQTVSSGIISGVGRELGSSASRARFLQTDAAINPGNSGGPLINLRGEVIGINTAIASNNGSFNGLGFAIPVNVAKWVTTQLINKGSVQRAWLGVSLDEELNPEMAAKLGTHSGQGALVTQVLPKTPAAEAGFEPGDVITKFAGHPVKDRSDLQSVVERTPVDTAQDVEVVRDGKTVTLHVTPRAMPKDLGVGERKGRPGRVAPDEPSTYESDEIGLEVADLTAERADSLGHEGVKGVLVTKVDPDKAAGDEGLRQGMLVLKVGKTWVKNAQEFEAAMKHESLKNGIVLLVRSQSGAQHFVLLKE